MTGRRLKQIGQRLFGNDWHSLMGRALKVHRTTIWRWTAQASIPDDAAIKVQKLYDAMHVRS